jgi:predicted RNA-binding Zn-ribbon protein involved in translation (DUF1610 family)
VFTTRAGTPAKENAMTKRTATIKKKTAARKPAGRRCTECGGSNVHPDCKGRRGQTIYVCRSCGTLQGINLFE